MLPEWLLTSIFLPLLAAPVVGFLGVRIRRLAGWLSALCAAVSTLILVAFTMGHKTGSAVLYEWDWIPTLGVRLSFLVDGVSLFFGFIVTVLGVLISLYSVSYLHQSGQNSGRFFAYLLFFMSSMLGAVFSDNLICLFMFWELTGIASFLLIGFYSSEKMARRGSRMALLVTASTGLVMLLGFISLILFFGTYSYGEILQSALHFKPELNAGIFILLCIGAFGKSAQFPFFFWLPSAMSAPSPVSAYLHSAAMVNLGLFLMARMFPLFAMQPYWVWTLVLVGFLTLVIGAILALLSHELKGILAYTTVSQLGFLMGVYGLASVSGGAHYDFFHLLNHVAYKGSLFMYAGIIAYATGIKDVRKMGRLFRVMPLVSVGMIISVAAMAAVPGTTGFISKDLVVYQLLMLQETMGVMSWVLLAALGIGTVCLTAVGCRLVFSIFFAAPVVQTGYEVRRPSLFFQLPPLILSVFLVVFGVFPEWLQSVLSCFYTEGLHSQDYELFSFSHALSIWWVTATILGVGGVLYWVMNRVQWRWARIPGFLRWDMGFEAFIRTLHRFSAWGARVTRLDAQKDYLLIVVGFFVWVMGGLLFQYRTFLVSAYEVDYLPRLEFFIAALIVGFVLGVVFARAWTTRLIFLSSVGFLLMFYFMLYHAPDLALTQMLIEAVMLILMLLLLAHFPRSEELNERESLFFTFRKLIKMAVAGGAGITVTVLILLMMSYPFQNPIGQFFLENAVNLAHGRNTVSTIVLDFRGFDTLGEITVLVIAALGVLGLLSRSKTRPEPSVAGEEAIH